MCLVHSFSSDIMFFNSADLSLPQRNFTEKMKTVLVFLSLLAVGLAFPQGGTTYAAVATPNCGCQCDAYTFVSGGTISGNCKRVHFLLDFLSKSKF